MKTTSKRYKEEIVSLALTVKFLIEDVEYLLANPKGNEREEEIKAYISGLKQFLLDSNHDN
ncbi:hypothetical protein M0R04_11445 [Candidatus Dojkabacteria bacterium]|jgi:hypothetical protein|nr:hypothetical protein [Candidatus Dojkabacteria bacterium]